MERFRVYSDGRQQTVDSAADFLARMRSDSFDFGWIDLTLDDTETLSRLADELDLHQLAVEDALNTHERPKISRFSTHLLMTLSAARLEPSHEVQLVRCTTFLLPKLVVTVHEDDSPMAEVVARLEANDDLISCGTGYIVWGLLDCVVDGHVDVLAEVSDHTDELTALMFDDASATFEVQKTAFVLRRSVQRMQHVTLPLREVVNTLLRSDSRVAVRGLEPYFSDVYDHTLHSAEWADGLRDQISMILETNVALQGNQMNEVMKKVTSWAAIIAVPTAITGYFGQNVEFPGFGSVGTWWVSNALLVVMGVGLYWLFKRSNWL